MKEIPVTNTTNANLHIGGKVIIPGETRMVDERIVPDSLKTKEQNAGDAEEPRDPIHGLLEGTVVEITAALAGLSTEELAQLHDAEVAGKNRKGVLEAIAADQLRRAAA